MKRKRKNIKREIIKLINENTNFVVKSIRPFGVESDSRLPWSMRDFSMEIDIQLELKPGKHPTHMNNQGWNTPAYFRGYDKDGESWNYGDVQI